MAYSAKSQKDYNDKCNRITLKYTEKETSEFKRLMDYVSKNGLIKTTYIKDLIKKDLDEKGFSVDSVATIDSADTP